jgi:hypothetical protein
MVERVVAAELLFKCHRFAFFVLSMKWQPGMAARHGRYFVASFITAYGRMFPFFFCGS